MASSARIDEIKKKFDENPRRYFAPLANEFRKAGDFDQAIRICEEFLPQQAGHMSGHIVYGQALFEAGRLPESRTVFETALGLDPENLIALRHLGDIANAQGEPVEARRWYDRVLEADPRNEEIQVLLAALDAGAPTAAGEITPIDLDVDESAFATPAPAPAAPEAVHEPLGQPVPPAATAAPDAPFDAISLEGFAPPAPPTDAHAGRAEGLEPSEFEAPSTPHARAEGLEPAEFEAPTGHLTRAEGLETTEFSAPAPESTDHSLLDLEGSFTLPGSAESDAPAASLAGLEESGATHPLAADEPALPSLDLDQGLAVPAHADAFAAGFAAQEADVPLGEAAGRGAENPRMDPPAAMEAMPALEMGDVIPEGPSDVGETPSMMELPPAVIAAESALMDAGDGYGDVSEADESRGSVGGQAPFVTETMAELYLSQGFHAQALGVYRQLAAAAPADERLRARVAMLERGEYDEAPADAGPTVREFLFRMATRRPGEGSAATLPPADADFASFDAVPEAPHASPAPAAAEVAPSARTSETHRAPEISASLPFMDTGDEPVRSPVADVPTAAPMPSPSERATTAQGGAAPASGTIDALFGTRPQSTSEDSAASALAQAFGGSAEAPAISGRPARAATAELSLDSVFRDGPPRPPRASQNFSFDQFFSESAGDPAAAGQPGTPEAAAGEPAERTADDVKQFNSWLQGLKPQ